MRGTRTMVVTAWASTMSATILAMSSAMNPADPPPDAVLPVGYN